MKKLLQGIALSVLISTMACTQPSSPAIAEKPHVWIFNITPQTTIHDIDSVSNSWRKDSIDLSFTKLEYTDDGKLIKIKGSMYIMPKGKHAGGTFTSDTLKGFNLEVDNRQSISISGK